MKRKPFPQILFLGAFLLLLSRLSFASQTPYLAIAGPGQGAGMMGHAFIVFANQPGQFLDAEAFQYGVRFPENFNFSITDVVNLSQFPFVVTKLTAWTFIKNYNLEGRYVHLFEIQLNGEQTAVLKARIENDRAIREQTPHHDYSVESNNCATKIYDQINSVIDNENDHFKYSSPASAIFDFSYLSPQVVAASVPLAAAPNLSSHPRIGNVLKFRSADMVALESNLVGAQNLEKLLTGCSIHSETQKVMLDLFGNQRTRENKAYLELISKMFGACAQSSKEMKREYNFHLDFIRYQSSDRSFIRLSEEYSIR